MKFLRRKDVEAVTGLSRSTIYEYMAIDAFPKQIKIGKRMVAWKEEEILAWMNGF